MNALSTEGHVPAGVVGRASSISVLIMCCCLHGTEPAPKANSIIRNRTVASDRLRSLHDADQQTSQMLGPGRFPELIWDRRDNAAAVANATTALTNGLSATNQKFVFMQIISSIRRPAFQKGSRIFPAPDLAKTGSRARSCYS